MTKTFPEILGELLPSILKRSADKGYVQKKDVDRAAQAILSAIEEHIIGESEYPAGGLMKQGRNQLRSQQRKALKGNEDE